MPFNSVIERERARCQQQIEAFRQLEACDFTAGRTQVIGREPIPLMISAGVDPTNSRRHFFYLGGSGGNPPQIARDLACGVLSTDGELKAARRTDSRGIFTADLDHGSYRMRFVNEVTMSADIEILKRVGDLQAREQIDAARSWCESNDPLSLHLISFKFPAVTLHLPGPPGPRSADDVLSVSPIRLSTADIRWAACDCCLMLLWELLGEGRIRLELTADQAVPQSLDLHDERIARWPRPSDHWSQDLHLRLENGDSVAVPKSWFDWGTGYIAVGEFTRDRRVLQRTLDRLEDEVRRQIMSKPSERSRDAMVGPVETVVRGGDVARDGAAVTGPVYTNATRGEPPVIIEVYNHWNGRPCEGERYHADVLAPLRVENGRLRAHLRLQQTPTNVADRIYFLIGVDVVGIADLDAQRNVVLDSRAPAECTLEGWKAILIRSPKSSDSEDPDKN